MGCCESALPQPPRRQDSDQLFSPPTTMQIKARDKGELRFSSVAFVFRVHESLSRRYKVLGKLGEGAYGRVWKALHLPSGQIRAIKTLPKGEMPGSQEQQMKREVYLLRTLDHPNIIQIHEVIEDHDSFHIITEYCSGGDLMSKTLDKVGETQIAGYMLQILSAIAYCHKRHIVHRDIKPENLLLTSDKSDALLKVIDFGVSSKLQPHNLLSSLKGTIRYMAPEVLTGEYNQKCDIWSCGILLYALLCNLHPAGHTPYDGLGYEETLKRIKSGEIEFPVQFFAGVSQEAMKFLGKLLEKDAGIRANAEELLRDEWLNEYRTKADSPILKGTTDIVFRSYREDCLFRQAALKYISWHLTPFEATERLTRLFIALDADRDGRLGLSDLRNGLADPDEASHLLSSLSSESPTYIQYHEFLQSTLDWSQLLTHSLVQSTFQAFDRKNNGRIDSYEVKIMLQGEQEVATPVWGDVLQEADKDGNGVVDFEEFRSLMMGE